MYNSIGKSDNSSNTEEATIASAILRRIESDDPFLTNLRIIALKSRQLQCPSSKSDVCYFRPNTAQDWQRLGEAIATNTQLRRLDLVGLKYDWNIYSKGLEIFYAYLNEKRSIRRLALNDVDLYGGKIFQMFGSFSPETDSLISLSATNYSLGLDGTRLLTLALSRKTSSLKYLHLSNLGIDDDACSDLVSTALLNGHAQIQSLELNGNFIQSKGCIALASFLKKPHSMLRMLYLENNSISDEGVEALANGLAKNKCLNTLSVHGNDDITEKGYDAFSRVLCNTPTISDILRSNHKLQRIGAHPSQLSKELQSYLMLNLAKNKRYVASQKVILLVYCRTCLEAIVASTVNDVERSKVYNDVWTEEIDRVCC